MPLTEDFSVFSAGEFSSTATLDGHTVKGIYDDAYAEGVEIEGESPTFECESADVPSDLAQGDAVVIGTESFTVVTIKPDGTGWTVIVLERVA